MNHSNILLEQSFLLLSKNGNTDAEDQNQEPTAYYVELHSEGYYKTFVKDENDNKLYTGRTGLYCINGQGAACSISATATAPFDLNPLLSDICDATLGRFAVNSNGDVYAMGVAGGNTHAVLIFSETPRQQIMLNSKKK